MKKILLISVFLIALAPFIFWLDDDERAERGNIFSTVIRTFNDHPILRIDSHQASYCFAVCDTIHVLQSYREGGWREAVSFRQDDLHEFPNRNIRVENENFAYVWLARKFAATADGGKSWTIWEASKSDFQNELTGAAVIKEVAIKADGKGEMIFGDYNDEKSETLVLKTEDFGKTWHR